MIATQKRLVGNALKSNFLMCLVIFLLLNFAAQRSSAATSGTYALSVSAQANHSGAVALNGTRLSASVYIFTSLASQPANFVPSGITKSCFWLDNSAMSGTATHCESTMPYDYAGSVNNTASSSGLPLNTASLANGTHTITQSVTKSAGGTETDTAAFTIGAAAPPAPPASVYALSVSALANHSGAVALNGRAISGSVYVFTSSASQLTNFIPSGITKSCFWLDNTAMSGTATHCESTMPYDFVGSVNNTASSSGLPLSTASLANGAHTITQSVTKSAGGTETAIATFSVKNGGTTGISLTTSSLPNGSINKAYSTILTAAGGTSPYKWSVVSGSMGSGLALSTGGTLSGTPTTAGQYTFSIQVQDSAAAPQAATSTMLLTVATLAPSVTLHSLPAATVKVAYSVTLTGTGGTTPYTWTLPSGTLPSGLSLSASGVISGTPTSTGSFPFTVEMIDSKGLTASASESLDVAASSGAAVFFSPSSFINTLLPASPSVDSNSASMVGNSLAAQASAAHLSNASYGVAMAYSHSTDKVYTITCTLYSSNTCTVPNDPWGTAPHSINFPIPKGVVLPSGTDKNTAFIYTALDGSAYAGMELDCWVPAYNTSSDTWSCATVSMVKNIATGWGTCANGDIQSFHCNGGYAAGFDLAAGPIRPEEIAAGYIPHALVAAISNPGTGIMCPATHTDKSGSGIPEGGHFFLPKSYNVDAQSWPSWVKIVAHALQNYGGYIVDYGGSFEIKGFTDQNATLDKTITWSSVGVPLDVGGNLSMIPWGQMQTETMLSCN